MPAARTLQAANAYEMIVKAVDNSTEAADQAKDAAENAASMVWSFLEIWNSNRCRFKAEKIKIYIFHTVNKQCLKK